MTGRPFIEARGRCHPPGTNRGSPALVGRPFIKAATSLCGRPSTPSRRLEKGRPFIEAPGGCRASCTLVRSPPPGGPSSRPGNRAHGLNGFHLVAALDWRPFIEASTGRSSPCRVARVAALDRTAFHQGEGTRLGRNELESVASLDQAALHRGPNTIARWSVVRSFAALTRRLFIEARARSGVPAQRSTYRRPDQATLHRGSNWAVSLRHRCSESPL